MISTHDHPSEITSETLERYDDLLGGAPVRVLTPDQRARFEGNTAEILAALGMDLDTPGTRRHAASLPAGAVRRDRRLRGRPQAATAFPTECHGDASCELAQIVEGPIPFFALCEHHALPFYGHAYVGYVAHDQIIGISKLTRLVRVLTRRFGVQERMTHQIARRAERPARRARRRGLHRSRPHVHPDARRARGQRQHAHDGIPRRLRARPGPALGVLPHRRHRRRQPPMAVAATAAARFEALIQAAPTSGAARGGLPTHCASATAAT